MSKFTRFTSHGVEYEMDRHGVINQLNPQPFVYDEKYVACYDGPEYQRQSDILMALRLALIIGVLGRQPKRILDVGCGNGAFCLFVKQAVEEVIGLDVTGKQIEGIQVISEIPTSSETLLFDAITFWDVIEHLHDLSFLRTLPTDHVFVSLPYCHLVTEGKEWFETKYRHLKKNEHIRHLTPYSLRSLMAEYGWKDVSTSTHEDIVRKSIYEKGLPNILSMAFKRA